tara:strand:- start:129 stop:251 length:123 start_codon:yes stop_codon:yes gene_type:complete
MEFAKKFFVKYLKKAKEKDDHRMIKFFTEILNVYDKHDIT